MNQTNINGTYVISIFIMNIFLYREYTFFMYSSIKGFLNLYEDNNISKKWFRVPTFYLV